MKPIRFMVLFWGDKYVRRVIDHMVPSLMADGNFPLLRREDGHQLICATTERDFRTFRESPILEHASRHLEIVQVEIDTIRYSKSDLGGFERYTEDIAFMSKAFVHMLQHGFQEGAVGSILDPDCIFADDLVRAILGGIERRVPLVVTYALRQSREDLLADIHPFETLGTTPTGSSFTSRIRMSPRDAASLFVKHLHPEMEGYDLQRFAPQPNPPFAFWREPAGRGMVLHSFYSLPVLMDYDFMNRGHLDCLKTEAYENAYISRNFQDCADFEILGSDRACVLSLTEKSVNWASRPPERENRRPDECERAELRCIRSAFQVYTRNGADRFKARLFRAGFEISSDPAFGSSEYRRQIAARVERACDPASTDLDAPVALSVPTVAAAPAPAPRSLGSRIRGRARRDLSRIRRRLIGEPGGRASMIVRRALSWGLRLLLFAVVLEVFSSYALFYFQLVKGERPNVLDSDQREILQYPLSVSPSYSLARAVVRSSGGLPEVVAGEGEDPDPDCPGVSFRQVYRPDTEYGWTSIAGTYLFALARPANTSIAFPRFHDWRMTFLEDGSRATSRVQVVRDRRIVVYGDSWIVGWGLDDELTVGWHLQDEYRDRYAVSLFANSGYGHLQALVNFRKQKDSLGEGDVIVVGYAQWLLPRNLPSPAVVRTWAENSRVDAGGPGNPLRHPRATVRDGQVIVDTIPCDLSMSSEYCARPEPSFDELVDVTKRILDEIISSTKAKVIVLLVDGPEDVVVDYLRARGVLVVDARLESAPGVFVKDTMHPYDGHPGAIANHYWFRQLKAAIDGLTSGER